jgi:hypothetical protein
MASPCAIRTASLKFRDAARQVRSTGKGLERCETRGRKRATGDVVLMQVGFLSSHGVRDDWLGF